MDRQLVRQLQQTVLIATSTSVNADGELQYSASTSTLARVVGKLTYMRNAKGEMITSQYRVVLSSTVSVAVSSRVYLPGETTSASNGWVPIAVKEAIDESGAVDHIKVYL